MSTITRGPVEAHGPSPSAMSHALPHRLFGGDFGGTTRLVPAVGPDFHGPPEQYEEFVGAGDTAGAMPWETFRDHPTFGSLRIYYEGGHAGQRWARVVEDVQNPGRKVLRFSLSEPNVLIETPKGAYRKSRVQSELYGSTGLHEFHQTVRMRLASQLQELEQYPGQINWFTLQEFWNQPGWYNLPYPFRMSFSLKKRDAAPGGRLCFASDAQTMGEFDHYTTVWQHVAPHFEVPFGTWMDLEIYYKEGGREDGRLYLAITPEGGRRVVLMDIHDCTRHPHNPKPAGLTHYNPMKLYTSAELVEFMRQRGHSVVVDWDRLTFETGRVPPL